MKRIIILSILLFLFYTNAYNQESVIAFPSVVGVQSSIKEDRYQLPLKLKFTQDFINKKLIILNSNKNLICKGVFDKDKGIQTFEGGSDFIVIINNDGSIQNIKDCSSKINEDKFFIKIEGSNDNLKEIKIKKDSTNPDQANKANDDNYQLGLYLYYDVLKLKEYKILKDTSDILQIFKSYQVNNVNDLNGNAYLSSEFNGKYFDTKRTEETGETRSANDENKKNSLLSTVSGLDVTTIADGFAKFIVKRTKQELNIAFFEKFQKEIEKYPDLKTVFPCTYSTLKSIGTEIYYYEIYLRTLRESFNKDLNKLPSNLPSIISNHEDFFNQRPDIKAELLTAFYIAQAFQENQNPGEIIENYDTSILDSVNEPNLKAAFQTLQLFSSSLKSNDSSSYWVTYPEIKNLVQDETLLKIYMGLLIQKAKIGAITFTVKNKNGKEEKISLFDLINNKYEQLSPYKTYIASLASKTQALNSEIKLSKTFKDNDSLRFETYYRIVSSTIKLMRYGVQADKLPIVAKDSLKLEEKTKLFFDMAQTSADMVIDVHRKNYALAVSNAVQLVELINTSNEIRLNKLKEDNDVKAYLLALYISENFKNKCSKKDSSGIYDDIKKRFINYNADLAKNIICRVCFEDYLVELKTHQYVKLYLAFKKSEIPFSTISGSIIKYGTFMAVVVKASNSDDVEAAIEAIALPVGSARIKRETNFNVSINAYCGLFGGYEKIKGIDSDMKYIKDWNSFGVTAPIGISISRGHSNLFFLGTGESGWKENRLGWSSTLFLSVVDIGAISAFRFTNDSTESVPKIKLKDIISPGIFYSVGIPKSPLSVNIGCQIGPLLREVTATTNTYSKCYTRFSVSLCIDLPMLNLYTSNRRR